MTNVVTVMRDSEPLTYQNLMPAGSLDQWIAGSMAFSADKFTAVSEFTGLFDQYRINWVLVTFNFSGNSQASIDTYFGGMPFRLAHAVDFDDVTSPASTLAGWMGLQERRGCATRTIGERSTSLVRKKIYPKMLAAVKLTDSTFATNPTRASWLDCSSPTIPHYGFKYVVWIPKTVTTGTNAYPLRWDITVRYCMSFKNMH